LAFLTSLLPALAGAFLEAVLEAGLTSLLRTPLLALSRLGAVREDAGFSLIGKAGCFFALLPNRPMVNQAEGFDLEQVKSIGNYS
jgi:hypothetical protein